MNINHLRLCVFCYQRLAESRFGRHLDASEARSRLWTPHGLRFLKSGRVPYAALVLLISTIFFVRVRSALASLS